MEPEIQKHVITEQDLADNPQLAADGIKVGDEVELSVFESEEAAMAAAAADETPEAPAPAEEAPAAEAPASEDEDEKEGDVL